MEWCGDVLWCDDDDGGVVMSRLFSLSNAIINQDYPPILPSSSSSSSSSSSPPPLSLSTLRTEDHESFKDIGGEEAVVGGGVAAVLEKAQKVAA